MNSSAQTAAIFVALICCYLWLAAFGLGYYSPQLAGVLALTYFGIRYARKKHFLPLTEEQSAPEFALVASASLLFIGSTGNVDSIFFPVAYVLIFLLTMSMKPLQAIAVSLGIVFFHYSLMETLSQGNVSHLISLFLMLFVFLFAKKQYEEHLRDSDVVEKQGAELSDQQSNAILFITTFLKPKLENLLKLSDYPQENQEVIARQIIIIQEAVEQLLDVVDGSTSEDANE